MFKKSISLIAILLGWCSIANAQSYPYPNIPNMPGTTYGMEETKKSPKTPQANFFEGRKTSTEFFADKSVTPKLRNESLNSYGQNTLSNNSAPIIAPQIQPQPDTSDQPEVSQNQEESWSAKSTSEEPTDELKNFNESLERVSEQNIEDPKIKDVIEQSKKIKEALFGKSEEPIKTSEKKIVKHTEVNKATKEIERF
jgi:hypothetical protein